MVFILYRLYVGIAALVCICANVVEFKSVDLLGQEYSIPYNHFPAIAKNITSLFITEHDKLPFLLNTALSMIKQSNLTAFSLLCMDCSEEQSKLWSSKGLHVIASKSLLEMSHFAFRLNGPMPYNAALPEGDMRRHNKHMMYREWIKLILLEHGITVFLVDIDIHFNAPLPFDTCTEDVILEGHWPNGFRPDSYAFEFVHEEPPMFVILNNGVALFTPTEPFMRFQREFMGVLAHETAVDFGFAQTGFVKLMNQTNLSFVRNGTMLTGKNDYGVTVRSFNLEDLGFHPAGVAGWDAKGKLMRKNGAWVLPDHWLELWNTDGSTVASLLPASS